MERRGEETLRSVKFGQFVNSKLPWSLRYGIILIILVVFFVLYLLVTLPISPDDSNHMREYVYSNLKFKAD